MFLRRRGGSGCRRHGRCRHFRGCGGGCLCGGGGKLCLWRPRGDDSTGFQLQARAAAAWRGGQRGAARLAFARLARAQLRHGARARCRRHARRDAGALRASTLGTAWRGAARKRPGGFGHHRHHRRRFRAPGALRRQAGLGRRGACEADAGRIHQRHGKLRDRRCWQPAVTVTATDRLVDRRGGGDTDQPLTGVRRRLDRDAHGGGARRGSHPESTFGRDAFTRQFVVSRRTVAAKLSSGWPRCEGVDGAPETERLRRRPRRTADPLPRGAWTERAIPDALSSCVLFARRRFSLMTLARP